MSLPPLQFYISFDWEWIKHVNFNLSLIMDVAATYSLAVASSLWLSSICLSLFAFIWLKKSLKKQNKKIECRQPDKARQSSVR